MMLTTKDKKRYSRHILLDEVGELGQQKLKNANVLVIGCGGLGCPVLQYLAAAGIGQLGIIDDDRVDVSNLQRQILFTENHVGTLKVEAAKEVLAGLNSQLKIETYPTRLSAENALDLFDKYDVIVEGSDSFSTKYLANDAALLTNKPLVFGSIFKFEGQVSVFNYKNGPTYRCLYPEPVSEAEMPTCSEVGVLGILPGIIGIFQANEVLKIILDLGNVLSGKLLIYNSLEASQILLPFTKNEAIKITGLIELDLSCTIPSIPEIDYSAYAEAKEIYFLVDVREQEEREHFNLGGLHIPLNKLLANPQVLAAQDNLVLYCASGKRSASAVKALIEYFPLKKIVSLKGGVSAVIFTEN
ncbi:HesA/MoeB/ThiF family protein [Leeuwenhoekiella sp. MAR_2009_132]|uniref:HesA/MoeB/ThiF family protein n=1 Tax=Leeuwenhoekiella sp. MAR_2009_132 TaxID=1392489 RepID=UPI000490A7BC|nr:HesA/MoeB/ThiF family protein [Leeuwenhoekiella sp. MAR_2009_132]